LRRLRGSFCFLNLFAEYLVVFDTFMLHLGLHGLQFLRQGLGKLPSSLQIPPGLTSVSPPRVQQACELCVEALQCRKQFFALMVARLAFSRQPLFFALLFSKLAFSH
jgi:hypothetical protein